MNPFRPGGVLGRQFCIYTEIICETPPLMELQSFVQNGDVLRVTGRGRVLSNFPAGNDVRKNNIATESNVAMVCMVGKLPIILTYRGPL